jgi:hypothetical protein
MKMAPNERLFEHPPADFHDLWVSLRGMIAEGQLDQFATGPNLSIVSRTNDPGEAAKLRFIEVP